MHWRAKGVIQKCLSSMPGERSLNDLLQRRFGELRPPERNLLGKLEGLEAIAQLSSGLRI